MRFLNLFLACATAATVHAQALTPSERTSIDTAVQQVVTKTDVPSVSVGIARGGHIVYTRAFGNAVLPRNIAVPSTAGGTTTLSQQTTKPTAADPAMAYPVGSISKQFTAACILLLQERGKLRLDDPVAKWFPTLTRANQVTVRNLLSHTSGYSDYAPQDYTIPAWTRPVDPLALVREWASKPLDFDPGTRWQYSNTNFELAALIVQKVSGQSFHDFLWQNIITPLKLQGVLDLDTDRAQLQVRGYEQHALGPMRPAILEAPGWYFGDATLAMPVATLLAWDESIVHRTLLKPESYDSMETEVRLADGTGSGYGLGVFVRTSASGKKTIYHSGEVGGFVSNNVIALNDDICYAALTNQEARVAGLVTNALTPILLGTSRTATATATPGPHASTPAARQAEAQAQAILLALQKGQLDRTLFTSDTNSYFSAETVDDYAKSLAALGTVRSTLQTGEELRGGMTFRTFKLEFAGGRTLSLTTYAMADGALEQFIVGP